jgi:HAD superfamily hydrolase (TIGR01484 family)
MKLAVIALDYDGTITREDRLGTPMIQAIADARRRGVAVMLVTGRRLDDLRRVVGTLHFVDGVVAENGALVHFPDGGLTTTLAPSIPPAFLARLQKEAIPLVRAPEPLYLRCDHWRRESDLLSFIMNRHAFARYACTDMSCSQ